MNSLGIPRFQPSALVLWAALRPLALGAGLPRACLKRCGCGGRLSADGPDRVAEVNCTDRTILRLSRSSNSRAHDVPGNGRCGGRVSSLVEERRRESSPPDRRISELPDGDFAQWMVYDDPAGRHEEYFGHGRDLGVRCA